MTDNAINLESVKPYGDHLGDGLLQVSFTLPVPYSLAARKSAMILAEKMGIEEPDVVHFMELVPGYTYFIVYGACKHAVNYAAISDADLDIEYKSKEQIEALIAARFEREIVVVGASTGTDTHSVGIDAILNMKGFNGEHGLERYRGMRVYNMGSQVKNEELLAKALRVGADVIMVSQTVTQQQLHVHNLTELVDMVEAEGIRGEVLLICGGPRLSNELAKELGFDAGFSKGCYPNHVASYIVDELIARRADRQAALPSYGDRDAVRALEPSRSGAVTAGP